MRESRSLRILCYILLPIMIAILIISSFYMALKETNRFNEKDYYASVDFAYSYMNATNNILERLIYYNGNPTITDGDIKIIYQNNSDSYGYYFNAQERYYLAIYENKAITNVELSSQTNTIDAIKTFINQNEQAKQVTIKDGKIQSDSEAIQDFGAEYFNGELSYYTVNEEQESTLTQNFTTNPNSFEVYSSFVEKFEEHSQEAVIGSLMNQFSFLDNSVYVILPISSIGIVLILIYLIISIGHKKGNNGISLNDFDKIPLEIIVFVAICIGCIPFLGLMEVNDANAIMSLIVTAYLLIYVLSAITLHTFVKRIKAKTLLKTTIFGMIALFIDKILIKIVNQFKKIKTALSYSTNITYKVFIYFALYIIAGLSIFILFRDSFLTLLGELALFCFAVYKVIKIVKQYNQIENKLKEMYEGNNQNPLVVSEFMPAFQHTVKYINDISNGFENAIQDRIKSERLKAELITNVSHDIKTPLTSIINYVDLLKEIKIDDEKAKEYIGILDNKSQRLKKLTEDLVEASKVSTGNISLNLEKINIVELIKQASGEFEDKFKKRKLETIINSSESEINIKADSRYMYRIIENLFSNIAKYALENSRVYVDIRTTNTEKDTGTNWQIIKWDKKEEPVHSSKQVKIEVKNISKDKLNISAEELMQRFVRGDKSRTTEGSGLGISIAQNLTELQNGEFHLKLDGDLFKVELIFDII